MLEPAVAEWDQHSNEYVPIEELKAADDPRWQAMVRGEWTSHDETPEQFPARIVGAIERIIAEHRGERVAVVCHGGVINGYLAHVLGLARAQLLLPELHSIHRVAAASTGERSHRHDQRDGAPARHAACRSACSSAEPPHALARRPHRLPRRLAVAVPRRRQRRAATARRRLPTTPAGRAVDRRAGRRLRRPRRRAGRLAPPARRRRAPFRIVGAHTDSPCLRIKPRPDTGVLGWKQLGVEVYGGVLLNSWLDRDLGIAGRVVLDGRLHRRREHRRADLPRRRSWPSTSTATSTSAACVLDKQAHLTPIWGTGTGAAR